MDLELLVIGYAAEQVSSHHVLPVNLNRSLEGVLQATIAIRGRLAIPGSVPVEEMLDAVVACLRCRLHICCRLLLLTLAAYPAACQQDSSAHACQCPGTGCIVQHTCQPCRACLG